MSGAEIPRCLKEQELSNSYKTRICLQSFNSQAYEKKCTFPLTLVSTMMELIAVDSPEVFFAILIKHCPVRYFKSSLHTLLRQGGWTR